jgi:hypothetical protein
MPSIDIKQVLPEVTPEDLGLFLARKLAILTDIFRVFPQTLQVNAVEYDRFLPNGVYFVIYLITRFCMVSILKALFNNLHRTSIDRNYTLLYYQLAGLFGSIGFNASTVTCLRSYIYPYLWRAT